MSRIVAIARIFSRPARVIAAPRTSYLPRGAAPLYQSYRFGSSHAHGGAAEPFLDTKAVTERIMEVIKNFEKVNATKLTPASRFKEDLDLDSLDAVEIVMAIEEEFSIEIPDAEADKILSIPDAIAYISGHPMAK